MENVEGDNGLQESLISRFLGKTKTEKIVNSLIKDGLWRCYQEVVPGLYFSNSLLRCFS